MRMIEPKVEKRGRGRPKHEVQADDLQLLDLPGATKTEKLQELYKLWWDCKRCPLSQARIACGGHVVFGDGNPDAGILVVGEAPGDNENRSGYPFVGLSGMLMNRIIANASIDYAVRALAREYELAPRATRKMEETFHEEMFAWRRQNFYVTNVVGCQPPDNRQPTIEESKTCWERLWNIIYIVDPLVIVAAGNSALFALTQKKGLKITKVRGDIVDVSIRGRHAEITKPVIPVYHPSYLLRVADWGVDGGEMDKSIKDWRRAMKTNAFLRWQHYGEPMPADQMKNIEAI